MAAVAAVAVLLLVMVVVVLVPVVVADGSRGCGDSCKAAIIQIDKHH